jgi:hypothetical protein
LRSPLLGETGDESVPYPFRSQMAKVELHALPWMSAEEHKAAYRRIIEAVNAGDFDALDALFATNMLDHNPLPGQVPGLAGFKQ